MTKATNEDVGTRQPARLRLQCYEGSQRAPVDPTTGGAGSMSKCLLAQSHADGRTTWHGKKAGCEGRDSGRNTRAGEGSDMVHLG